MKFLLKTPEEITWNSRITESKIMKKKKKILLILRKRSKDMSSLSTKSKT